MAKYCGLCSYYIPDTSNGTSCLEQLREALCRIHSKHKRSPPQIIIAGDLNLGDIDWIQLTPTKPQTACHHTRLIELMAEFSMSNLQIEPSRPASGNCLDLLITNLPTRVDQVSVSPGMSDHHLVQCRISNSPVRSTKPPHKFYLYKKCNTDEFKNEINDIRNELSAKFPPGTPINVSWSFFRTRLTAAMDKCIPSKLTKSKHNLPWINHVIKRQMRKRDRLFKKASKSSKPSDWATYRHHRNQLANKIKHAYHSYVNEVIGGALEENPKRFWNFVRLSNTEHLGIPTLVDCDNSNNLYVSDITKADALNNHFKAQFTQERGNIPTLPDSGFPDLQRLTIGIEGVEKQLLNIKPNKASGPDEIPARIFRDFATELAPIMRNIFRRII